MQEATVESHQVRVSDGDRVQQWLSAFEDALRAGDRAELESLFVAESHWRDLLAFTWNVTPTNMREAIVSRLLREQPNVQARTFRVAEGHIAPRRAKRTGVEVIEAIFQFQTAVGRCLGVLRLPAAQSDRAWTISTSLRELKGHEEPVGGRRPDGTSTRIFGGEAWGTRRAREQQYKDREPAVLIVGGGHNGLILSARLRMLGVDSLVVERLPNVGDVWRHRYDALALHNEIVLNHMPYMPFPATWPRYLPKDMLGDWLEVYARALECNVWTNTVFLEGRYDEAKGHWSARMRQADGSERVLHPRHLVFANGIVGEPKMPDTPGLEDFKGQVVHAQGFGSGAPWRGKSVLVLGVGNSAHDIAQDLRGHGANVKMIQRGSIAVFSVKAASLNHAIYYNEGLSLEDADLIASSNTFPVLLRGYQLGTQRMLQIDKDLLAALHEKGFKLDIGPEGGGHQMHVRKNHGGYYLNVGCSDLIVSGDIGLLHYEDIDRFVADGTLMKDGHVQKADLVVAATGYHPPSEVIRRLLGQEIAEKIGPVWGLDDGGEMCNMYKPTPQKGLWFIGGGFAQGRVWSQYVALQIKAREAGIVEDWPVARPVLDTLTGPPRPYREPALPPDDAGLGAGRTRFERNVALRVSSMMSPGRRLRELLRRDQALMAAGAFSPMPAKIAEQAGFEAVYMPGGGTALDRLGVADLGLITMTEMIENATAIAASVSVPVIADADTGFGNALNVRRTVRDFERAGVAAIHLEDQVFPKRCGHLTGKVLISTDEAVQKIRAAVDARADPDFMIIARCDAISVTGMDDAVRRGQAYLDAGADMLFIESPRSMDEVAEIPRRLPGRHLFNMSSSGRTPFLSVDEVSRLGYKLMILPNFSALAAIKAITEIFVEIRRSGTVAGVLGRCASFEEFTALGGLAYLQAAEKRFAGLGS